MPTPSKFTGRTRYLVLEVLSAGASRREAARAAGIDPATLARWIARGRTGAPEGRWRRFADQVLEAERNPRIRGLVAGPDPFEGDARTAWWFLERREPGFAPSRRRERVPAEPPAPLIVQVSLSDGRPLSRTVVDPGNGEDDRA